MMWFWLSLIALLCWSGSDLFSKMGSKPDDKQSHWKMVMAVGLVMGLHALYEIFVNHVSISWQVIWAYMPASALYILSMILGYIGLRYIELSISTPICNTSGAVAALFLLIGPLVLPKLIPFKSYDNLMILVPILIMAAAVLMLGIVETREDEAVKLERQKRENVRYVRSALALALPLLYCLIDAAGTAADAIILNADTSAALRISIAEAQTAQAPITLNFTQPTDGKTVFVLRDAAGNETDAITLDPSAVADDAALYTIYDADGEAICTLAGNPEAQDAPFKLLDDAGEALYAITLNDGTDEEIEGAYYLADEDGEAADYMVINPAALSEDSANVAYELTFLFMGVCAAVYVLGVKREKLTVRREAPKLIAGVCETAGQFAYIYAIAANAVGAAPIISCYCLLSVLWSRIILKEKLSWKHYLAIGIAGVGIALMGLMDP